MGINSNPQKKAAEKCTELCTELFTWWISTEVVTITSSRKRIIGSGRVNRLGNVALKSSWFTYLDLAFGVSMA